MCGILAVHADAGQTDLEALLQRGASALAHRGPDEEGFYIHPDKIVGLAHRRLSVMAPENGQQPLSNEDGRVRAIVNGEFYDSGRIRDFLTAAGHTFSTQSDSEILVHLYEQYGDACLSWLRGEFAFVLWDENRRRLFAARDRFGVKPLLYSHHAGSLLLASEARALFAVGVPAAWDHESFLFASSLQYLPPDRTLFRDISMVPPGAFLVFQRRRHSIRRYWRIPRPPVSTPLAGDKLIEACAAQIQDAVSCRLQSDSPVCFQLSGGLDSSSVAGIAATRSSGPIDVFSIGFPEVAYSEFEVAERSAAALNARWHPVEVSQNDLLTHLPAAVVASEGLSINGHVAAKSLLHQQVREAGFKVVLTGEGADEAFYGYAHLRMDHFQLTGQRVPRGLVAANRTSRGMMLPAGESLPLHAVQQQCGFVPGWIRAKATLGWKLQQLLRPEFRGELAKRDPILELLVPELDRTRCVSRSRDAWTKTALAGYILNTLGDGTEMPHSVEGRVPFLDHKLWEFLAAVPVSELICRRRDKPLLRDAVRPFVTSEVLDHPKHPFDAPPLSVFGGNDGREFVREHLRSAAAESQPFFCPAQIETQLDELDRREELRQVWDPPLMLALSTVFLQQLFRSPAEWIGASA